MFCSTKSLDLTPDQIDVIEAALHTQEKILSMQSKAGTDSKARIRLNELKSVLRSVRKQNAGTQTPPAWTLPGRAFFTRQVS